MLFITKLLSIGQLFCYTEIHGEVTELHGGNSYVRWAPSIIEVLTIYCIDNQFKPFVIFDEMAVLK